jgi:hypothetical protein
MPGSSGIIGLSMYALSTDPGIFGERVAVILGFMTLFMALTIFVSCRSCLSFLRIFRINNFLNSKGYQVFNRYHNYYWWIFGYFLVIHVWMAVVHTGFPAADDPDASIHWVILWSGIGSLALSGVVLSSCRSFVYMLTFFRGSSPLGNWLFRESYKFHSYYWLAFLLAVAGHFAADYYHVGLWPK